MSGSHKEFPKKAVGIQLGLAALVGIGFLSADKTAVHAMADKVTKPIVAAAAKVLAPIGKVEVKEETGGSAARSGEEIYTSTCGACHNAGIAGAPKLDDNAAWETRLAGGYAALVTSSIEGKGGMPARGGNPDITDSEMELAVSHMIKKAGIDLVPRSSSTGSAPATTTEAKPATDVKTEETTKVTEESKVEKVAAKVEETTEEVKETVVEKVEETKVAVAEKVEEVKEAVVETTAEVAEKAKEVKTEAVAAVAAATDAVTSSVDLTKGKTVYKSSCFACHDSGVAGSPKIGDKDVWTARLEMGNDHLYESAINGKGAMPAKGGNMGISDEDIKAAVDYMISESK